MTSLDKTSHVPLYRQLVDDLVRRIDSGELQPGDRLPSEREMAESLKVSRITARQALDTLEQLGLVYREQGRGTFAAAPRLHRVEGFSSFSEYFIKRGRQPNSRIIKQELIKGNKSLRGLLKLAPDERVLHLVRVRLADDTPLALQSSHLPQHICPGLENEELASRSLFNTLREKYGVYPTWTEPQICAAPASETEAGFLELAPGAPVLVVSALTYTETFEIVEQVRTVYRGTEFWLYLGRQHVSR